MAQDVVPLEPWKDKCPWCGRPILIKRQLVVYEDDSDYIQFVGLAKNEQEGEAK